MTLEADDQQGVPAAARAIGARLRERRKALGWTQKQAAERFGLHEKVYPLWESGQRLKSWPRVLLACETLGVSPNELLGYDPIDRLADVLEDGLDPRILAEMLEAVGCLAVARADDERPSGGDEAFWKAMGSAFAQAIVMTVRGDDPRKVAGFIEGVGYLLRC